MTVLKTARGGTGGTVQLDFLCSLPYHLLGLETQCIKKTKRHNSQCGPQGKTICQVPQAACSLPFFV